MSKEIKIHIIRRKILGYKTLEFTDTTQLLEFKNFMEGVRFLSGKYTYKNFLKDLKNRKAEVLFSFLLNDEPKKMVCPSAAFSKLKTIGTQDLGAALDRMIYEDFCKEQKDYEFYLYWFGELGKYYKNAQAAIEYLKIEKNLTAEGIEKLNKQYANFLKKEYKIKLKTLSEEALFNDAKNDITKLQLYIEEVEKGNFLGLYLKEAKQLKDRLYFNAAGNDIEKLQVYYIREVKHGNLLGRFLKDAQELEDKLSFNAAGNDIEKLQEYITKVEKGSLLGRYLKDAKLLEDKLFFDEVDNDIHKLQEYIEEVAKGNLVGRYLKDAKELEDRLTFNLAGKDLDKLRAYIQAVKLGNLLGGYLKQVELLLP